MKTYSVTPGTSRYRQLKKLYLSAFPAEERLPLLRLWLLSKIRPAVALQAYEEHGTFCGFTLTVCSEKYLYINFIAVNPSLRSRGIGAKILGQLREQYPGKPLLVEIEAPDEHAENNDQRQRRVAFYLNNGFYDLNRNITGRGVTYTVLATDLDYDREAYMQVFEALSFGLREFCARVFGRSRA